MTPFLLALPWLAVLVFVLVVVRFPAELPAPQAGDAEGPPLVSVIVPARDERLNIEACLSSLTESTYPAFEVVVVDDGSADGTGELAAAVPPGRARSVTVLTGDELPDGWIGKPWACHQGARVAAGDLLLFTDADTIHAPELLGRAVAGLRADGADLLTVVGRQLMESFWERLVQPQVFLVMMLRFPAVERTVRSARWREAIANGQFMLFRRAAYEAIGGHASVRDEVVEDLALAQRVKRHGLALRIRSAERDLATRMYRSLGEIVDGWSKNLTLGGLQSVPPALRPVLPALALVSGLVLWIAPALLLGSSLAGFGGSKALVWSAASYTLGTVTFAGFTRRMGTGWWYGVFHPLGAAIGAYIFLRSWIRGRNVEWKGRRYVVTHAADRP